MSARTQRREIDVPLRWPVVIGLLSSYFLFSGVLGVALGRGIADSLNGLVPSDVATTLTTGVFATTAGLVLARTHVLAAIAIRVRR
jgi:hypothetical protein